MMPGTTAILTEGAGTPAASVTETAFTALEGSSTTSHSFTGVSFGPTYSGRWMMALIFQQGTNAAANSITSLVIGGVSVSTLLYDHGEFRNSPAALIGVALAQCQPSGVSGNITFTTPHGSKACVAMLSVSGFDLSSASSSNFSAAVTASSSSTTLTVPSSGLAVVGTTHYSSNSTSWSNLTARRDQTVGSARVSYAYDFGLGSGSRTITASFSPATVTLLSGQAFVTD